MVSGSMKTLHDALWAAGAGRDEGGGVGGLDQPGRARFEGRRASGARNGGLSQLARFCAPAGVAGVTGEAKPCATVAGG
jgi:hypothetical protein